MQEELSLPLLMVRNVRKSVKFGITYIIVHIKALLITLLHAYKGGCFEREIKIKIINISKFNNSIFFLKFLMILYISLRDEERKTISGSKKIKRRILYVYYLEKQSKAY